MGICNIAQTLNCNNMGYNLLKGMRGIIFGALVENSIAWKVAEKAHEEGPAFDRVPRDELGPVRRHPG